MMRNGPGVGALLILATFLTPSLASVDAEAQSAPASGGGGGGAGGASGGGSMTAVPVYPGAVAPPPPGQPVGGGNAGLYSSGRPSTGSERDTFDLAPKAGAASVVRGGGEGPVFSEYPEAAPEEGDASQGTYSVKKGDTLWGICDRQFQNPYVWPKVWSFNPQIQNPHWIEVGDEVRLRPDAAPPADASAPPAKRFAASPSGRLLNPIVRVPPHTVFLREEGFVESENIETVGEVTGSPLDKTFLTKPDDVYIRIAPKAEVRLGQELTAFRAVRKAGNGKLVQLQATVRINQYNPRDKIARATVIESLEPLERGARLAVIPRRFEVVPPVRNANEVEAHIIASTYVHRFYGAEQVVFIDKGADDGLVPGNRLFFIRRGDEWRRSLVHPSAARRIVIESEAAADDEAIKAPRDEQNYPDHIVGELRVLNTHKKTSMCIVSHSEREIENDDVAYARKGY